MAVIRVGVQSPAGGAGQLVDLDGPSATIASITNASGESIQYSVDGGVAWTTVASGASSGTGGTVLAGLLRMRKVSSGAYPAPVDVDATINGLTAPQLTSAQVSTVGSIVSVGSNRAVILGDSLVENGLISTATTGIYTARNIASTAAALLNQRLDIVANKGVSGQRMDQFLARFDADVAPFSPNWVIVIGCSNDIPTAANRTAADILASIDGIKAKCDAINARMVFMDTSCGGFSSEAEHTKWYAVGDGCKTRHLARNGFFYAPMWLQAVDHSTQTASAYSSPAAGMLYDSRHPAAFGVHTVYAKAMQRFFEPFLPAPKLANGSRNSATVGDLNCLVLNGGFPATGGTPGTGNTGTAIGTLWTGARTGTISAAWSQAARTDGGAGQWQIADLSGATAATDVVTISSPTSSFMSLVSGLVGSTVRFEVDVVATASSGTIGQMEFQVQILNSSGGTVFTANANQIVGTEYLGITSFTGRLRCPDFVLPAASDRVTVVIRMGTSVAGAANIRWSGMSGRVIA